MPSKTTPINHLATASGRIPFPSYIPVTTFGKRYPLDDLVRPYLPRLAAAMMVSFYYAQYMKEHPGLPLLIDSGGFASLFKDVEVNQDRGLGVLERSTDEDFEITHPKDVLDFQEKYADVAFTLDKVQPS